MSSPGKITTRNMFSSWKLKASCGCKMTYYSSGCYRNNNFVDSNGRSGKSTKGSFLGLEEVSSSMGVRMRMPPPPDSGVSNLVLSWWHYSNTFRNCYLGQALRF